MALLNVNNVNFYARATEHMDEIIGQIQNLIEKCNEEISNLELAKIAMICDYLVLDRFTDISSFQRFEMCFGPLFNKEKSFLVLSCL